MNTQIEFSEVKGYATYANAKKRGDEVAKIVRNVIGEKNAYRVRFVIIAKEGGRFIPAFPVSDVVNPGFFLGFANVCTFN